jgi:membrane-bound serine protease (ClpP class)
LVLLLCAAGSLTGALARGAATQPAATAPTTQPATHPASTQPGAKTTDEGWFAPAIRQRKLPPLPKTLTRAVVIPVREEITEKTYDAIRRKLVRCQASGAQLIVLDMDTWGGDLFVGLDIARLLKTDAEGTRVVCYVRTRAISAGSMIALACDEIVMAPVGMLGDCGVVMTIPEGVKLVMPPDKQETVVRAEMRESAKMHGYSVALTESMADDDLEVWLVRDKNTRELRHVGKVTIPPGLSEIESNPKADWEMLRIVVPKGKLLTMTSSQALEFGFASAIVDSPRKDPLADLARHYNVAGEFEVLQDSWSEALVEFLTSGPITALLLFGALLCGYIEMHTPGFGLFGTLALIFFGLMVGSRYLTGLAQWWEIAVFILGLALLAVELFITPGFGVMGTLGIIFCLVGLVAFIVPNAPNKLPLPSSELAWSVFQTGAAALGIGLLASVAAMMMLARFLPKVPVANWVILKLAPAASAATSNPALAGMLAIGPGRMGVVTAICRPAGQVRFGEDIVDAVTEGEYIPAGTQVKVIRNESNRVVVTRA